MTDAIRERTITLHSTLLIPKIDSFSTFPTIKRKIGNYKVGFVSPNFEEHFADLSDKDIPGTKVSCWECNDEPDGPRLMQALSDAGASIETHLAHMMHVITLGERGPGLFDRSANVHCIRSPKDGNMWAVTWYLNQSSGKIYLFALPISMPLWWKNYCRVFTT